MIEYRSDVEKELDEEYNTFSLLMMMMRGADCSGCLDKRTCSYQRFSLICPCIDCIVKVTCEEFCEKYEEFVATVTDKQYESPRELIEMCLKVYRKKQEEELIK